jgi:hypothetical protein
VGMEGSERYFETFVSHGRVKSGRCRNLVVNLYIAQGAMPPVSYLCVQLSLLRANLVLKIIF